jgi:apolipoprotein D and lipocalin family protein
VPLAAPEVLPAAALPLPPPLAPAPVDEPVESPLGPPDAPDPWLPEEAPVAATCGGGGLDELQAAKRRQTNAVRLGFIRRIFHRFDTSARSRAVYACFAMRGALQIFALTVAMACATSACGSQPPLDVAPNVDLSRFQGKWYEIARLPRTTQTDCHGTTAFYTQAAGGVLNLVNQCNVGGPNGPLNTVSMTATAPNSAEPAKLALSVGGFSGDYWILEVGQSYEYAVVGHPSREYLWILSRTPTLDGATMQGVVNRAQSRQFDTSRLEYTPQPPAGERNALSGPEGPVPPAVTTGCVAARAPAKGACGGLAWALGVALAAWGLRARGRLGSRHRDATPG